MSLLAALLGSSWAAFLWKSYLRYRQYNVQLLNEKRPREAEELITDEDYHRARDYNLDKHKYWFAYNAFNQIWTTILFTSGWLPWLWQLSSASPLPSIIFLLLKLFLDSLIDLPWEMYYSFVVEERHGFNKQTLDFFLKDQLKYFVLYAAVYGGLLAVTEFTIEKGGPYFYIYAWVIISVISLVFLHVYPTYIAPLFDEFVPLPDGELKVAIEKQAASLDFPLKGLFVVIGSKRSAHSNAYMYGFWKNKRIVIFDTILCAKEREKIQKSRGEVVDAADSSKVEGMTNDEMLAVLGHELGHWALWNSLIIMGLFDINLLIMLSVFARFYHWELLYEEFGFSATPPLIGIILVYTFVLGPYLQLAKTFLMVITRQCEYAADRFSAKLGRTSEMISALKKLAKDNLDMPVDDPLHSMCTRSHPTTAERIRELRKMQ